MSQKAKNIVSLILTGLPALMLVLSSFMKITRQPAIMDTLGKTGFGPYIVILGVFELAFAVLLLIPKTRKLGFLFATSYLGGAAAIEIAEGRAPIAFVFIAMAWVGMYLHDKAIFVGKPVQ